MLAARQFAKNTGLLRTVNSPPPIYALSANIQDIVYAGPFLRDVPRCVLMLETQSVLMGATRVSDTIYVLLYMPLTDTYQLIECSNVAVRKRLINKNLYP